MTPDLGRALLAAVDALDALRLRYAVVGGLAVSAWGVSRSTRDADLYADLPDAARALVCHALQERAFHVPAMEEELGLDALVCPKCQATMRPIATLTDEQVVRAILVHLGWRAEPLPRSDRPRAYQDVARDQTAPMF